MPAAQIFFDVVRIAAFLVGIFCWISHFISRLARTLKLRRLLKS